MKKIFEVNFNAGKIIDTVSNTALTVRGSIPLKMTGKGLSSYSSSESNTYQFTKSLNGVYSLVLFYKRTNSSSNSALVDFRNDATPRGFLGYSSGSLITVGGGTIYVNGLASITPKANGVYGNVIVSGMTITSATLFTLTSNYLFSSGAREIYMPYFAIYSGTITQKDINNIQDQFNNQKPLSQPTNLSTTRSVIDFEQNIAGNNYVTVADADSLDFGTGSFSIYWEDSYPQRQAGSSAKVLGKDNNTNAGFQIIHNGTSPNTLALYERNSGGLGSILMSNIPLGLRKFLFVRNTSSTKYYLYVDGALVYTSSSITMYNLSTSTDLFIKGVSGSKTSGSFKNLKIWKGQVVTWSQATQKNTYKTGLSLDLPLDEGQGSIVYDTSGNGNNGTLTSTFPLSNWTRKTFKLDKSVIDWKYDRADGTAIIPNKRIPFSGTFKLVTATTDLGNYGKLKKGSNRLECLTAGKISYPCNRAYGTFYVDVYKTSTTLRRTYITSDRVGATAGSTKGYFIQFDSNNQFALFKDNLSATALFRSNNSLISTGIYYRVKVKRDILGTFTCYIIGGAYTNRTLITTSSGTNPIVDNTFATSSFICLDLNIGGVVGEIIYTTQVE